MGKLISILTSKLMILGIVIVLQFSLLLFLLSSFSKNFIYVSVFFEIFSFFILLYIVNHSMSASAKLPWVVLTLVFPFVAIVLVLVLKTNKSQKAFSSYIDQTNDVLKKSESLEATQINDPYIKMYSHYLYSYAAFKMLDGNQVDYFPVGEKMYDQMLIDLNAATHSIYMQFFIIDEGIMWSSLKEILINKAKEGLDVRLMYDDLGCLGMINENTPQELQSYGIKVVRFNPIKPKLSVQYNARDHRKICVIDKQIAYTGGLNIADEYINQKNRFGHWKDTGIKIMGPSVNQLLGIFLQSFNYYQTENNLLVNELIKQKHYPQNTKVQCFSENPFDKELVSQTLYSYILNHAKNYVYIYTPYLIVDGEMMNALKIAAKRGVDVKIILPHHPDKWYVHLEAQSSYRQLIDAGVQILEYEPGFMHAKSYISDDQIAIVGTINMDYRSLYHHFENGVLLYDSSIIQTIKKDFDETLSQSILMERNHYQSLPLYKRFIGALIKFFAPLM